MAGSKCVVNIICPEFYFMLCGWEIAEIHFPVPIADAGVQPEFKLALRCTEFKLVIAEYGRCIYKKLPRDQVIPAERGSGISPEEICPKRRAEITAVVIFKNVSSKIPAHKQS